MTARRANARSSTLVGLVVLSGVVLVTAHLLEPGGLNGLVTYLALVGGVAVGGVFMLRQQHRIGRARSDLRATEHLFCALVKHSSDAAMVLEADGIIRFVSPVAKTELNYEPEALIGMRGRDLIHPDDLLGALEVFEPVLANPGAHATAELRIRDGDGAWRWVEEVATNLIDEPAIGGIVINIRDIATRKEAELANSRMAHYDRLTELPNRWLLMERLEAAVHGNGASVALLIIDLDQFKFVNDSRGHAIGDRLLLAVARRLADAVPTGDTVARLGGDEFAVICLEVADPAAATARSQVVLETLREPFELEGAGSFFVSASVGIACACADATPDALMQQADTAMYTAKNAGRSQSAVFDARLRGEAAERLTLEGELRAAVGAGELIVHYQPVIDVSTSTMTGVEALVRWRHPTRGLLLPGAFIPVAEQSALIERIDDFVLRQACEDATWWARAGSPLSVAVNISATQLCQDQLAATVRAVLYDTGLPPDQLVLEVTETAVLVGADRAMANVDALRALGIHVALDDFGTGYSSLAYLKRVPADIVKIDRSFVEGVADSPVDRDIVASVINLAAALGRTVIAEGIETDAQYAALRQLGCPLAQGYLWSPAIPSEDILPLAHAGKLRPRSASIDFAR